MPPSRKIFQCRFAPRSEDQFALKNSVCKSSPDGEALGYALISHNKCLRSFLALKWSAIAFFPPPKHRLDSTKLEMTLSIFL